MQYIVTNIKTPDRFVLISGPNTSAFVAVEFEISVEGDVANIFIYHSREWSVDLEAIRVLKNSPKWKPAQLNGQPIIDSYRQRISFRVNNQFKQFLSTSSILSEG